MGNRKLKLFLLICLLNTLHAAAQQADSRLDNYNSWLSATGLKSFFSAKEVRTNTVVNKSALTLVLYSPARPAELPGLAFQWTLLTDSLNRNGINIYQLLLTRWAFYSHRHLPEVAVSVESNRPEIFSAAISFNKQLISDIHCIPGRGSSEDFHPEAVLNNIIHGSYRISGNPGNLLSYFSKLQSYFLSYKHSGSGVIIDKEVFNETFIRLRISNILGQATGQRYHEIIYLNLNLVRIASTEAEVSYSVDILYAGGIVSAPDSESYYRDASIDFPREMVSYNNNLDREFRKVLYGE